MYFLYILYSAYLDRHYIGFTEDITIRIKEHLWNNKGFTSKAKDGELKYSESFDSRTAAIAREREIKKMEEQDATTPSARADTPPLKGGDFWLGRFSFKKLLPFKREGGSLARRKGYGSFLKWSFISFKTEGNKSNTILFSKRITVNPSASNSFSRLRS